MSRSREDAERFLLSGEPVSGVLAWDREVKVTKLEFQERVDRLARRLMQTQEDRAWQRGYARACEEVKHQDLSVEDDIRYCRIYAMAYAEGWVRGKKTGRDQLRRMLRYLGL